MLRWPSIQCGLAVLRIDDGVSTRFQIDTDQPQVPFVVIRNQDVAVVCLTHLWWCSFGMLTSEFGQGQSKCLPLLISSRGESKRKGTAFAEDTFDPDLSLVCVDDAAAYRQSQSNASGYVAWLCFRRGRNARKPCRWLLVECRGRGRGLGSRTCPSSVWPEMVMSVSVLGVL